MPFLLFVVLLIVAAVWLVAMYNGLVTLRNQMQNAWKQIDVQLKRRYDLIPNLVESVKDSMSYEQETLQKVIQARQSAMGATGIAQQAQAEGELTRSLRSLFALAESYPDLKANQNVKGLMEELTGTENKISFARQFYNDMVMRLNTAVQKFPTNILSRTFGFSEGDYFELEEAAARQPVKVDLR